MIIIEQAVKMRQTCEKLRFSGKTIGFVPTMGALHEGHLSLVRAARQENDVVIVSIFVNPIQFGPNEDFNKYPRTFERDCSLLDKEKVDFLFFPPVEEMYGKNFETYVDLRNLPNHLCGLKREGHFRGVATVVTKLFNITLPNRSYFGQKDYQQAQIIRRMVEDLNFFIDIKIMPIIREKNGLAMSSRNQYLTEDQKERASALYRSLKLGESLIKNGKTNSAEVKKEMEALILKEIPNAKIDYISIADLNSLEEINEISSPVLIALAVYIGDTRLIDNEIVKI